MNKNITNAAIFNWNKSLENKLKKKILIESKSKDLIKIYSKKVKVNIGTSIPKEKIKSVALTPREAMKKYSTFLTDYEKSEMIEYSQIYFISTIPNRHKDPSTFSDSKKYYNIIVNDQIGYRYEILEFIGKGSFGQVLRCFDHKEGQIIALKILKCETDLYQQGLVEANILRYMKENDPEGKSHTVKILNSFFFRMHIMITTEFLSFNLYRFLEINNFRGISMGLIRHFASQLVDALCFLSKHQIIHCDLKPENILLEQLNKSSIKVIDFGSSCFSNEKIYTYIQSRFYRAPEVMLGIPYTTQIDMWSLGCILAELYVGYAIFPGESDSEQMSLIMEINGVPPMEMIKYAPKC